MSINNAFRAKHGLKIGNSVIVTGITNDSGLTNNSEYSVPTEYAVKQYVNSENLWERATGVGGGYVYPKNLGDDIILGDGALSVYEIDVISGQTIREFTNNSSLTSLESQNSLPTTYAVKSYVDLRYNQSTGYTDTQLLNYYTKTEVNTITATTYNTSVNSAQTYTDLRYNQSTGYTNTQLLNYYTKTEVNTLTASTYNTSVNSAITYSNNNFVNKTGDTMTGQLTISATTSALLFVSEQNSGIYFRNTISNDYLRVTNDGQYRVTLGGNATLYYDIGGTRRFAMFSSYFAPATGSGADLGASSTYWRELFVDNISLTVNMNIANSPTSRQIAVNRAGASTNAGFFLLRGSGAPVGENNKNGGELRLSSGIATGSGSSYTSIYTATAGVSGTTDRNPSEKIRIDGDGNFEMLKGKYQYHRATIGTNTTGDWRYYVSGDNLVFERYDGTNWIEKSKIMN